MEQEIDIKQVWLIIKKRWVLFVIFPLLAALISGLICFYILKPIYESSTTLIVGKKAADIEELSELLTNNALSANRQLAKTYGEIAKSRTVREQVIAELNLALSVEQLESKINVNLVEDTEILEIAVTDKDPQLAADIANVTAQKFNAAIIEIKKVDSVSIVDKAVAPHIPVKPQKKIIIFITFLGGLLVAFGLSILLEYLDDTINSSAEAEELLGLSVLGVILEYRYDEDIERKEICVNTS